MAELSRLRPDFIHSLYSRYRFVSVHCASQTIAWSFALGCASSLTHFAPADVGNCNILALQKLGFPLVESSETPLSSAMQPNVLFV